MRKPNSNTIVLILERADGVGHDIDVIIRAVENDTLGRWIVTRSVSEGLGFAALADASG